MGRHNPLVPDPKPDMKSCKTLIYRDVRFVALTLPQGARPTSVRVQLLEHQIIKHTVCCRQVRNTGE